MTAVVQCRKCRASAVGELPERAPAGWEVIFANRVYGRGGAWSALCPSHRGAD